MFFNFKKFIEYILHLINVIVTDRAMVKYREDI